MLKVLLKNLLVSACLLATFHFLWPAQPETWWYFTVFLGAMSVTTFVSLDQLYGFKPQNIAFRIVFIGIPCILITPLVAGFLEILEKEINHFFVFLGVMGAAVGFLCYKKIQQYRHRRSLRPR